MIICVGPSDVPSPVAKNHLGVTSDPHWTVGNDGLLRHDNRIYVPDANDPRLRVLQDKHDHVLSGHFGQGKTLDLVRREYYWPNLRPFIVEFCKSCASPALRANVPKHPGIGLTATSSSFRFPSVRGILSPWISLSSFQAPWDIRRSLSSLTGSRNKLCSFRLTIRSLRPSWRNCLSFTCSPSMAFRTTPRPTEAPNSSRTSSGRSVRHWTCACTSHLATTRKAMVRPNEQTKPWNNTFVCTATTSRITGTRYSPSLSLLIIMHRVLRQESHHFSLTKVTIQVSLFTPNAT